MAADIRVRIAPSPTGPLHIRDRAHRAVQLPVRAAHRRHVRAPARGHRRRPSTAAFEQDILDGLHWLGITWDEGPGVAGLEEAGPYAPYRQMARLPDYAAAAATLLAADAAYPCYCSSEELEADRREQEANKLPPRYVGRCAALTPDERARARPRAGGARSGSASARASSRGTTSCATGSRSTRSTSAATS